MDNDFYKAFEDKHRGSRELIKSRLNCYLPFINLIKEEYEHSQAIDLGCGRGEWLELLNEQGGFEARGVDLDRGMLDVCEQHGLQYTQQDALTCLNSLADESQALVTGFHLAEHIPFTDLQALVKQALRVLKPAGLLILETPNPENITVGTSEFYMDPTHSNPLPPHLLKFLPDYYGFQQTKIIRLQEDKTLICHSKVTLLNVLKGVSPDYAIVAQKNAKKQTLGRFKAVFEKDYGITLEFLAEKYDQEAKAKEERLLAAEEKILAAEAKTQATTERLILVFNSRSWRYTAFFRRSIRWLSKALSR